MNIAFNEKDLIFLAIIIIPMLLALLWYLAEFIVVNFSEICSKLRVLLILLLTPVLILISLIIYGFKGSNIKRRVKEFWA